MYACPVKTQDVPVEPYRKMALYGFLADHINRGGDTYATAPVVLLDLRTQNYYLGNSAGWKRENLQLLGAQDLDYMTPAEHTEVRFVDEGNIALIAGTDFMNKVAIVAPDIVGAYSTWMPMNDEYRYCFVTQNEYLTFSQFLAKRAEDFLKPLLRQKGEPKLAEAAERVYFQASVVGNLDYKQSLIVQGAYHLVYSDKEMQDRFFSLSAMTQKFTTTARSLRRASQKYINA